MMIRMLVGIWSLCVCAPMLLAQERAAKEIPTVINRGHQFLVDLVNPEFDLLPEFAGHNIIWLYHDNYLAYKVLQPSHPEIAAKIVKAIEKYGVARSGKIEILFGEAKLPLRHYELRDITKERGFTIRSEFTTDELRKDIESYADLLLFSVIADEDRSHAELQWKAVLKMWDGHGFQDKATVHMKRYATYKLALAMIAAKRRGFTDEASANMVASIERRLIDLQSESGGWITDYLADGKPVGFANVETTCLAIMALE